MIYLHSEGTECKNRGIYLFHYENDLRLSGVSLKFKNSWYKVRWNRPDNLPILFSKSKRT